MLLIHGGTVPRAYPVYVLEMLWHRLYASLTSTLSEEIMAFLRGEMQEERVDVIGANLKILDVMNSLNSLMDGLRVRDFLSDSHRVPRPLMNSANQVSGLTFFMMLLLWNDFRL